MSIVDDYVAATIAWRQFGEANGFDADDDAFIDELDRIWCVMTPDEQAEAKLKAHEAVPLSVYIHKAED